MAGVKWGLSKTYGVAFFIPQVFAVKFDFVLWVKITLVGLLGDLKSLLTPDKEAIASNESLGISSGEWWLTDSIHDHLVSYEVVTPAVVEFVVVSNGRFNYSNHSIPLCRLI